jgi:hypothetical protein
LGLVAVVHSILGERYILIRLFRRNDLPKLFGSDAFTRRTLRFAWHITSVMGLGLAAIIVELDAPGDAFARRTAEIISATCALSGLVALVGSRGRHLAWIAFFAIAVLTWLGSH